MEVLNLGRLTRVFQSIIVAMVLMMSQISMAAALNDNIPDASPVLAANGLKVVAPATATVTPQVKNQLTNVRWLVSKDADGASKLRLVIDASAAVKVNNKMIDGTNPQLIIDVQGATVGKIDDSVALDGEIADKVAFIKKDSNNSQVVIDLSTEVDDGDYKVFTLPSDAANKKTFRVVVDITKPVPKTIYNFTAGLKNKVIVIDPGHGGSDPGAIGAKTQEKIITLAVAQKVQALLEKEGAKVVMTRTTDVDVYGPNASAVDELKARANVGNNNKADAFLSIHINSFTGLSVGGTAAYYYKKTNYDATLASCIQDSLVTAGGLQDRGTYAAKFYVLKHTQMPATLAELGFISNPKEEQLLSTPQFQQQLAQGIVTGLDKFFTQAAKKGGGS
jgi:N-acetylmuramoyl-L-alanine amidase